jgi:hypothetical protein
MSNSLFQFSALGVPLFLSFLALACGKKEEPRPQTEAVSESASAPASANATAPDVAAPSGAQESVEWKVPDGWTTMPARMMRKATYEAPGAAGPAEIGVFYFGPGQGGTVEDNITRWVGQFKGLAEGAVQRSEKEVDGMKRFNVDIEHGTFESGMPGTPAGTKEDFGMSASIVQTPSGQYFFKMTGPALTVKEQRANFQNLLDSIVAH